MTNFDSLDLLAEIKKAIKNIGYDKPTAIQAQAIPDLILGRDLLGIAQTGTGKTAAFSLPILNRLGKSTIKTKPKQVRSLVLTPTRELASQIHLNMTEYGSKELRLSSSVIFGGVGATSQIKALQRGVDILVATPGRLLDLMREGHVGFEQLEVFVLDEADRMLDMGFIHDVKKIITKLPLKRQTLLFSATMPGDIAKLANSLLVNPKRVEVTPESTTVEKIHQKVCFVERSNKDKLLAQIIQEEDISSVLVFTRTKHGADKVVRKLQSESIEAAAIHGNKSQNARERVLNGFREGKIKVLIATDIAARGIDVDHVSHVINYNLPEDPKNYVHRIGRTARAGREGVAIAFCDESEMSYLRVIEKHIKLKLSVDTTQEFHVELVGKGISQNKSAPQKNRPSQSKKARRRRSFRG